MAIFRSRRLEDILGTQLEADAITYAHVERLKAGQIPEATDLDFKKTLYGNSSTDKRDLCGDVAAQANTRGGLIVLGVDEIKQDGLGVASDIPGVALSENETSRMLNILRTGLAPFPAYEIVPVPDPARPGLGCYLIIVPRSPRYPIGVAINDGYRYPFRNGATIGYLSEPDIETAYRARWAAAVAQKERAEQIEREAAQRRGPSDIWLVMSLVPDIPGALTIDNSAYQAYREEQLQTPTLIVGGSQWARVLVGPRRYRLDGTWDLSERLANSFQAELHTDGAGVFAAQAPIIHPQSELQRQDPDMVSDEAIAIDILSGLRLLARHARDVTAAAGGATVRAYLHHIDHSRPVRVGHSRHGNRIQIGQIVPAGELLPAEVAAPLDDLADDGPPLVSAAGILASGLVQVFSMAEIAQFTAQGEIRKGYWSRGRLEAVQVWAAQAGVAVTNAAVGS
ncbi:helix-turn-helix domain-containing protein [Microbispora sp. H10949]|uniref:AlbA family DNA-binding domain-containing protein n=1 Tax=Microbispora sp. H10949 TaxID=2729111 RepID=UPI001600E634|nr:ATP-binding protein [Microbispora sp. H10949]